METSPTRRRPSVAVIGAGFSGSLLALHLLSSPRSPRVFLIEKTDSFGPGLAYGTRRGEHRLNVRAGNMSAWPDQPFDFLYWLAERRGEDAADPAAFAARADYGAYLRERIAKAATTNAAAGQLVLVGDEAVGLRRAGERFEVELAMGRRLDVDAAVLAFGNMPPRAPEAVRRAALPAGMLVEDPWAPLALDAIGPHERVLLLGAGLTMADVVAALDAQGHEGAILALSRRGLAPQRHIGAMGGGAPLFARVERLSLAVRAFRRAARDKGEWRALFDGLRPVTQNLWLGLSEAERARFLRHLRPWWDAHRHRLAPATADRLDALRGEGRLRIVAGKLDRVEPGANGAVRTAWRGRGRNDLEEAAFDRIIVCTGPDSDLRRAGQPLVRGLLADGLIRPDRWGLGLDVDTAGQAVNAGGEVEPALFALGPATRGAFWEVTAVPDIRIQAAGLAQALARAFPGG